MRAKQETSCSGGWRPPAAWSAAFPCLLLSTASFAANHLVTANTDMTFKPATLTIVAGDTVTFHNNGGIHNVKSDPGAVTSFRCANGCDGAGGNGNLSSAAWSATVRFPTVGTIGYFCERHGAAGGIGMAGRIIVTAYIAQRSNFNGDNRSDILWRNNSTGANVIWRSASSSTQTAVSTRSLSWRAVGIGDYNGDRRSDILWRNSGTGANVIWRSASSSTTQAVASMVGTSWTVAGSGDYNGDGRADIFWRNTSTGANVIWRSASSATPQSVATMSIPSSPVA
jgi:plastocyanin